MSQIKKLDNLINKVLEEKLNIDEKEEMKYAKKDFREGTFAGRNAIPDVRNDKEYNALPPREKQQVINRLQNNDSVTLENEGEANSIKATDIAGEMSEILDKLNNMSEMKDDDKYKKHATKAAKYMEAAKAALEGLTDYETMLEEKEKQNQEKGAGKTLKAIEKALSKIIKDKTTVSKIMHKMPVSKVIELQAAAQKGIDEEKVAKAMLNVALREGYLNNNSKKN